MTLQQFKSLSEHEQYRNLLINGICLTSRDTADCCMLLFQINDFYIEVYFDMNCDEITGSRSFNNIDELHPYLEKIDITGIV
jgi:hypothetical protein